MGASGNAEKSPRKSDSIFVFLSVVTSVKDLQAIFSELCFVNRSDLQFNLHELLTHLRW